MNQNRRDLVKETITDIHRMEESIVKSRMKTEKHDFSAHSIFNDKYRQKEKSQKMLVTPIPDKNPMHSVQHP